MEIIKRFQADRWVRQLQSGARLTDAQIQDARSHLLAMGAAAVRALLTAVQAAPASPATLDMITRLVREDTFEAFVEGLRSQSPATADAATAALSASTNYRPTDIFALYADPAIPRARIEAVLDAQSARIDPEQLVQILPSLSKEARASAYRIVERIADQRIVPGAVSLASESDWWLRQHAARLLGRFNDAAGRAVLARLLRDENGAVRLEAVRAAASLKSPEAIAGLCACLRDPDMKVQVAAIEALVSIADVTAVPHLLDALKDESEYVRRGAVEVLNEVITPEAIKDLVDALRDADWWVRARSADALGTLGGPRVVEAVLELTNDPDEFARRYAIEILNTVPDPRAVPVLIKALEDDDWWVRERAVDALGKAGDPAAVGPLLRMMGRDTRTLPLCVRALGAIGTHGVVEPLCRLVDSQDADTRREAIQALVQLMQRELPEEARHYIATVLDKAGIRTTRHSPAKPMDVRPTKHAHPPRGVEDRAPKPVAAAAPRPPRPLPPASGEGASPLNFQKLAPGTDLANRFRVVQRIGGGGFGTVYLVEDLMVREEMVLKILSPHLSLDPAMIRRFVQELKLTRRITHNNVIRIHDLLDLESAHAISMEYFPSKDLGVVLREEGPLSPERTVRIAEQALEGLGAAHSAGILHRDIKPANLLIGDGDQVKIVDFGLASVGHGGQSRLTQSGILVGTPEYISPEQITDTAVDARCDLYSLGIVLYEAMSGVQPFTGTSPVNVLFQHLEAEVPPLDTVAKGIPKEINDVVMAAMSRHAADRPASATVMLEQLRARPH